MGHLAALRGGMCNIHQYNQVPLPLLCKRFPGKATPPPPTQQCKMRTMSCPVTNTSTPPDTEGWASVDEMRC